MQIPASHGAGLWVGPASRVPFSGCVMGCRRFGAGFLVSRWVHELTGRPSGCRRCSFQQPLGRNLRNQSGMLRAQVAALADVDFGQFPLGGGSASSSLASRQPDVHVPHAPVVVGLEAREGRL